MMAWVQTPLTDSTARVIRAVVARPEFVQAAHPKDPVLAWLSRYSQPVVRWIIRVIQGLINALGTLDDRHGKAVAWCLGVASVIILAWAASHLFRTLRWSRPSTAENRTQLSFESSTHWTERSQRARLALAAGDLRRAATELFAAVVGRLSEHGELHFAPCKTGGDYQKELVVGVGGPFAEINDAYERIVFGGQESDATRSALVRSASHLGVSIDE